MEFFDVVDESGYPTGEIVDRDTAHREGVRHRTAHVWVIRKSASGYDVLLQKRSMEKDSFPGLYDTSSAGHIPAGAEPLESAIRELAEELGITAGREQLEYAGLLYPALTDQSADFEHVNVYCRDGDRKLLSEMKKLLILG